MIIKKVGEAQSSAPLKTSPEDNPGSRSLEDLGVSEDCCCKSSSNYPPTVQSAGQLTLASPASFKVPRNWHQYSLLMHTTCGDTGLRREEPVGPVCQDPKMGAYLVIHTAMSTRNINSGKNDGIKSLTLGLL